MPYRRGVDLPLTGLREVTVALGDGPPVLRDVTLLAGPGEVLAVLGPSGSGKTTVLRAVAGLERVRRGRVLVAGRDVTAVPTAQRRLAMVFQETALLPFLDVAAHLGRSAPGGERHEQVGRLGLRRLLPRMARTLSPGEGGRVGVGRALVRDPDAFLFDEPLAHLDPVERTRIRRVIAAAVARAGVAALYVTHDRTEAMAVADRLAVLRDGEVVQTDTPTRVYDRPVDVFVADVVAESGIGLLPARVVVADGRAGFAVGARTLPLWAPPSAGLVPGRRVVLGLRAEVVGVAGPGADPGSVRLPVTVGRVEHTGHRATVVGEVAVPGDADGARLVARTAEPPRTGERVEFVVDARRAHVFDAVTGRALLHPGVTRGTGPHQK